MRNHAICQHTYLIQCLLAPAWLKVMQQLKWLILRAIDRPLGFFEAVFSMIVCKLVSCIELISLFCQAVVMSLYRPIVRNSHTWMKVVPK